MRALLDVNVLIALLDSDHIHHARATDWLRRDLCQGWASCPITQNGCIRIMSHPSYPGALRTSQVAERLAEAAITPHHAFWPDDVDLLTDHTIVWSRILGHRQLTDSYLLALAVRHGGRLITLDKSIAPEAVLGATSKHMVLIE